MFNKLFVKKYYIEDYYIADVIVVGGSPYASYEVLETDKPIIKLKNQENLCRDLETGYYHTCYDKEYKVGGFGFGWVRFFQITKPLVYYYPFLATRKISIEEAKILFENIPKIKKLLEKGMSFKDIGMIYNKNHEFIETDKILVMNPIYR